MAARRAAIDRIALGSHADNADHRPQRNAQALVPNKLIAVDFTHLSAPSIETIAANALVFARTGNRLVVELDGIDAHHERAARNRPLHEDGARSRIGMIPVDSIELVFGLLNLVAEAVLRANAHRRPGGYDHGRLQRFIESVKNLLVI